MVNLFHGDCLELMREIPDQSIDLILCDLPYETTACKWDKKLPFNLLWQEYNRVKKTNTPIVLFANQPFTTELIASNRKQYRYNWYWIKTNVTGFCFARYQPMRALEEICVFYENLPVFNQQTLKKGHNKKRHRKETADSVYKSKTLALRYRQESSGYLDNILFFEGDNLGGVDRYHPTQKPVKLLEFFIRVYTNIGDVVLDNTIGSGSTGVAAVNTGRDFIGIEKEKKYFAIAEKRIQDAEKLSASNLFDVVTLEGDSKAPPHTGNIQEDFFK